jgi:hypothetical protein
MISALPQILLMLYLFSHTRPRFAERYGISGLSGRDLRAALLTFLGTGAVAIAAATAAAGLDFGSPFTGEHGPLGGVAAQMSPSSPLTYLLILVTCVLIGYHEELYFRAYLLSEFAPPQPAEGPLDGADGSTGRRGGTAAAVGASLLFGAGHVYQGAAGFLATFSIGLFLSYRFLRRRSLHEVAIAHTLYNFAAITLLINIPL